MVKNNLPEEYEEIKQINLVNDKKTALLVNAMSFVIMLVMILIGGVAYGYDNLKEMLLLTDKSKLNPFVIHISIVILMCVAYLILHEAVHALVMKLCSKGAKVKLGLNMHYSYAGSDAYYNKVSYEIISAAPLLFFGILLTVLCMIAPIRHFWIFYTVQILNFSVAAGDFYIFLIIARMPRDILINDSGTEVIVYGK